MNSSSDMNHEANIVLKELRETAANINLSQSEKQEREEKMNARLDSTDAANQEICLILKKREYFEKSMDVKMDDLQRAVYASSAVVVKDSAVDEAHTKGFHQVLLKQKHLLSDEMYTKFVRTDVDPQGGYLAPNDFSTSVVDKIVEISPMRQNSTVLTTNRGLVEVPVNNVTEDAFWVGECETVTESQPTFDLVNIPINKLGAEVCFTQEALEDSVVNLVSLIENDIVRKFAQRENQAFLNGDSVKKPEGILTNADIFQFPSSVANDYTADDVIKLAAEPKTGYNLAYYMHRSQLAKVRTLEDTTGRFIFQMPIEAGKPSVVNGDPVFLMPDMTKTTLAGEIPIMVADLKMAYRIYDHAGLFVRIDDLTKLRQGKICWVWFKRTGGAVVNPEAAAFLVPIV